MRELPNRYKTWNKILIKHENKFAKIGEGNIHALLSNQGQFDADLRKHRMSEEEYNDLTNRTKILIKKLKEKI